MTLRVAFDKCLPFTELGRPISLFLAAVHLLIDIYAPFSYLTIFPSIVNQDIKVSRLQSVSIFSILTDQKMKELKSYLEYHSGWFSQQTGSHSLTQHSPPARGSMPAMLTWQSEAPDMASENDY